MHSSNTGKCSVDELNVRLLDDSRKEKTSKFLQIICCIEDSDDDEYQDDPQNNVRASYAR
jgi:hypothetical protein